MIERLESILKKYNELVDELNKPDVYEDFNTMKKLSKEKTDLEEIVNEYNVYKNILTDLEAAEEMLNNEEMIEYAQEEIDNLKHLKEISENKLSILLIPKDKNDDKNIIMEIRGAAGGDEANIFAGDLYRMYSRYIEHQGWKIEVLNEEVCSAGGYSQIEMMVKGDNVYSKMKFENGSHRVQRVPQTETQGRVHTSTATVLVMPEAEEIDVKINDKDLKIDVYHSGGAGGQSVNTTDSAVRITHLPTGIVVTCQNERSQIKNKEKAMTILKSRVYELELTKQEEQIGNDRRIKIGKGDRSEKIRTYNYPQNRVTDHRINLSVMYLDKVMNGDLNEIIEALITEDHKRKLEGK